MARAVIFIPQVTFLLSGIAYSEQCFSGRQVAVVYSFGVKVGLLGRSKTNSIQTETARVVVAEHASKGIKEHIYWGRYR